MAQDDYWYEIHLSNKQLVFYFMAAATGLILSFLAGVMVGRGVDADPAAQAATRAPRAEEKVVAEEPVRPAPPSPEDMTYAQRLESERTEDALEKPGTSPRSKAPAPAASAPAPAPARPSPAAAASVKPTPAPAKPTPAPVKAAPAPVAASGTFALQVGAFKDRAGADSMMNRLKGKGLPAYVQAASGGLFNVRVGAYASRGDAEQMQARLRDQEKLTPFVVKN